LNQIHLPTLTEVGAQTLIEDIRTNGIGDPILPIRENSAAREARV